ncbi:MAG: EamA family transporter RarD [Hyphomonadaceae bacterium]
MQQSVSDAERRAGFIAAAASYFVWGILPLYLKITGFADPREVLAQRILWSAPVAFLALAMGGMAQLRVALKPRMLGALSLSAFFLFGNWALLVWAVAADRVMEAALAYFLAPLVNVAFGVAFFQERLTRAQIAALTFAGVGVIVQGVALGAAPIFSLSICGFWCLYGLVRKRAPVSATAGMFVETSLLIPAAIGLLIWVSYGPGLAFTQGVNPVFLLALFGPITAVPLMWFAFGARRLRMSTLGLLQYIAPSLQFLLGLAFGESFTPLRAASFALIWVGLVIYTWDAWRSRARVAPAAVAESAS